MSNSLGPYGLWHTRLFCSWGSPGKDMGEGCHALFQGIFPTQGLNLCLLYLLHLTGRFFTIIATWEAPISPISIPNFSISGSTLTSLDVYCAYHLSPQ